MTAEAAGTGTGTGGSDDVARVLRALNPPVEIDGRVAVATFEPQPEHRGNPGWLHGGLAATVLDHVCARAAAAAIGQRVVTGRLDVRYPQPVMLADGPYRVEATAEEPRGRMVRVVGAILDREGRPMVEARSLFVTLPDT
ncbi:MAG: PaaI family thioesterase [Actinomycetota bacterium]